jgi:hypothetical protein
MQGHLPAFLQASFPPEPRALSPGNPSRPKAEAHLNPTDGDLPKLGLTPLGAGGVAQGWSGGLAF